MCRKSHSYEGLGPEIRLSNQSRRLIVSTVFRRVEKRFSQLKAGLAYGFYDTAEAVPFVREHCLIDEPSHGPRRSHLLRPVIDTTPKLYLHKATVLLLWVLPGRGPGCSHCTWKYTAALRRAGGGAV